MAVLIQILRWLVTSTVLRGALGKISIAAAISTALSWLGSVVLNLVFASVSVAGLAAVTDYVIAHLALASLPLPAQVIQAMTAMGVTSGLSIIAAAIDLKLAKTVSKVILTTRASAAAAATP